MKRIVIINGRTSIASVYEADIYDDQTLTDLKFTSEAEPRCSAILPSNHEGFIIDEIENLLFRVFSLILNPGAFTHTSLAL